MRIIESNEINNTNFFETIEYDNFDSLNEIYDGVKNGKDSYLMDVSRRFNDGDFASASDFVVSKAEIEDAYTKVSNEFIEAVKLAKNNIQVFSQKQLECFRHLNLQVKNSVIGHKLLPLKRVLCYVPGGNYPLPSSCLMTTVPALVAGVPEVILTSPRIKPETIVAADIAGVKSIYKLGGAQAIFAFAYGTESIQPVDKIVGPGNKYVTAAKKRVFGTVDIDFLAGPSEVLIVADESANPTLVAADMLAQCEHDKDARAYLVCFTRELAQKVQDEAQRLLGELETKEIAGEAFDKSFAVIATSIEEVVDIVNKRAPEHLELCVRDENKYLLGIINFGSLFIGNYSAEAFGDYNTGTNHVLPTNRASRYTGGLCVLDFLKAVTFQKISKDFAEALSISASELAKNEGLFAHKLAADLRREN